MEMDRPNLPLTALRAFEVAARQGSFTAAATELCVSQAAVSHQVISLEKNLGVILFKRSSTGLILTDEGMALLPVLTEAFDKMSATLDRFLDGHYRETLNVGVVTTFATGWLLDRLPDFQDHFPGIDVRISTNNNSVDLLREGLEVAIRFGDGDWRGVESRPIMEAAFAPLCAPTIAEQVHDADDLAVQNLLRSYRSGEWPSWFAKQGKECPDLRGPIFDSSVAMAEAAASGKGVTLLPVAMFQDHIQSGRLVQPLDGEVVLGSYWLTYVRAKEDAPAIAMFEQWLFDQVHKAALTVQSHPLT